jgi:hypothetical protein
MTEVKMDYWWEVNTLLIHCLNHNVSSTVLHLRTVSSRPERSHPLFVFIIWIGQKINLKWSLLDSAVGSAYKTINTYYCSASVSTSFYHFLSPEVSLVYCNDIDCVLESVDLQDEPNEWQLCFSFSKLVFKTVSSYLKSIARAFLTEKKSICTFL